MTSSIDISLMAYKHCLNYYTADFMVINRQTALWNFFARAASRQLWLKNIDVRIDFWSPKEKNFASSFFNVYLLATFRLCFSGFRGPQLIYGVCVLPTILTKNSCKSASWNVAATVLLFVDTVVHIKTECILWPKNLWVRKEREKVLIKNTQKKLLSHWLEGGQSEINMSIKTQNIFIKDLNLYP